MAGGAEEGPGVSGSNSGSLGGALMADMLKDVFCADVTLKAKNCSFSAHRCVLATCSPVFRQMFLGGFREASASSPVITMDGMDDETVKMFLEIIYTGNCDGINKDNVQTHGLPLLAAADKFGILKMIAVLDDKLSQLAGQFGNESFAFDAMKVANAHGAKKLEAWCKENVYKSIDQESYLTKLKAMVLSDSTVDRLNSVELIDHLVKRFIEEKKAQQLFVAAQPKAGQQPTSAQQQPAAPAFGSATASQQPHAVPAFGSATAAQQPPAVPAFGSATAAQQPPAVPAFGSATAAQQPPAVPAFGSATAARQPPAVSLFGSATGVQQPSALTPQVSASPFGSAAFLRR
eukprot:TRINITY_DN11262_c0_g1_i1.p1 TRINITY_DN11262_c0_g1~~TRINITY_DN11262_c0_g1_i1.p1  ORF type:complete len:347 (-),score=59.19 TRINITY_DN11262_c0_g1_i1:270-1310(-)